MRKPEEIFDRDHEWSDLVDFVTDPAAFPTLGVVSGRRRQGKTLLLDALSEASGGFYFGATEATEAESLSLLGERLRDFLRLPAAVRPNSWQEAIDALLDMDVPKPTPVVIDEFPYLVKAAPSLPSILQHALDRRRRRGGSSVRLILCGSALSFMGGLLAGSAPLRGRAGLELLVSPLDYRQSAEFWGISDPKLAVLTHAVVGGTPAYRREYVRDDAPQSLEDFDGWVRRAVLNPGRPLFREARYLLAAEPNSRDAAIYHSVLAAVAEGNASRGGIAGYVGRKASDISHPLTVLEDSGLLKRVPDVFREGRPQYRVTEPLVIFYEAIMKARWTDLERRRAHEVWKQGAGRFAAKVVGPHFEELCRDWAKLFADEETLGGTAIRVGHGVVNDPGRRTQHEVDVVVLGEDNRVLMLGEAKWGKVMGETHVARLERIRTLLEARGYDVGSTKLACFSGTGFTPELVESGRHTTTELIDLDRIYA